MRDLVSENKISILFQKISLIENLPAEIATDVILQKGLYSALKEKYDKQTITLSDYDLGMSRIRSALLNIVTQIEQIPT